MALCGAAGALVLGTLETDAANTYWHARPGLDSVGPALVIALHLSLIAETVGLVVSRSATAGPPRSTAPAQWSPGQLGAGRGRCRVRGRARRRAGRPGNDPGRRLRHRRLVVWLRDGDADVRDRRRREVLALRAALYWLGPEGPLQPRTEPRLTRAGAQLASLAPPVLSSEIGQDDRYGSLPAAHPGRCSC